MESETHSQTKQRATAVRTYTCEYAFANKKQYTAEQQRCTSNSNMHVKLLDGLI